MQDITNEEKKSLTPESGFNLVGIDPFASPGNRLYLIEHFDLYFKYHHFISVHVRTFIRSKS